MNSSGTPNAVVSTADRTPNMRATEGKTIRKKVPRSSHGAWVAAPDRPDPVELIREQERDRVQELLPLRHQRMFASPFTFYRGAAVIQAADLASGPSTGLLVQAVGDAHLANFGGFSAPERSLVFDMNDFDETNPAPFEWDVKRLAVSFELAGRPVGADLAERRSIVRRVVRAYRDAMAEFAAMRDLDVWYSRLDVAAIMKQAEKRAKPRDLKRLERNLAKGRKKNSLKAYAKLTEQVDDERRIASKPPILVPLRDLDPGLDFDSTLAWLDERVQIYRSSLQRNRRHLLNGYRIVDAARKVVGVGSVGTRTWVILMLGRDDRDPLFLQVKEAGASVLEPYTGGSEFASHGQRVVEGQRLLQSTGDVLLGWMRAPGFDGTQRDYYVRQLWDGKMSPDFESMSPEHLKVFGKLCAWTLARGHARSGDRIAIASYLGSGRVFDDAIADYSAAYADQNDRDYKAAMAAWAQDLS